MADKLGLVDNSGGGQACSDKEAADCLAQGHPKASAVPTAWGMKDQQCDDDNGEDDNGDDNGEDDDARSPSFGKSARL